MVQAVRRGATLREAGRRFRVAPSTVLLWVRRAAGQRLDRVDWSDRPSGPHRPCNRTDAKMVRRVLILRKQLHEESDLGEFGAEAIRRTLVEQGLCRPPSVRTVGRILERHGALDGRKRVRRPAPPRGWYLPLVTAGRAEIDSFDIIHGLVIRGGIHFDVLTAISVLGGLPNAWPMPATVAKTGLAAMLTHWRQVGLPTYAQFDNDTRFQGPHNWPDKIGRVIRACLSLGVTPVFAVPRETGWQAAIEHFNGRRQISVWSRFEYACLAELIDQSNRYITACHVRRAVRIEAAPTRRAFPKRWPPKKKETLHGQIIFLRRTDASGHVRLLARRFYVDDTWLHRLVRAEVDLDLDCIRFYALRRREPTWQPLLNQIDYKLPD